MANSNVQQVSSNGDLLFPIVTFSGVVNSTTDSRPALRGASKHPASSFSSIVGDTFTDKVITGLTINQGTDSNPTSVTFNSIDFSGFANRIKPHLNIPSLDGVISSFRTNGSGNVVIDVQQSGNELVVTKGTIQAGGSSVDTSQFINNFRIEGTGNTLVNVTKSNQTLVFHKGNVQGGGGGLNVESDKDAFKTLLGKFLYSEHAEDGKENRKYILSPKTHIESGDTYYIVEQNPLYTGGESGEAPSGGLDANRDKDVFFTMLKNALDMTEPDLGQINILEEPILGFKETQEGLGGKRISLERKTGVVTPALRRNVADEQTTNTPIKLKRTKLLGGGGEVGEALIVTGRVNATEGFFHTSDARYKHILGNVEEDRVSSFIDNLNPVLYHFKDQDRKNVRIGIIAQEVEQYFPEVVKENENGIKSVNYAELSVIALSAVKSLTKRIEELEEKLNK